MNYEETRPWGKFEILTENNITKVKKITVKSGGSLSYQYHNKRSEVWVVIQGNGVFTLDGKSNNLIRGSVVEIPVFSKHKIENDCQEDLIFIEVQIGDYFGEDDIVRLYDNYGRT